MPNRPTGYEQARLDAADTGVEPWREWGPYVAERAWGSVREDYSAAGDAWASFPFEHAVSRCYRWNEDGLSAWSDDRQRLCIGLALWNGVDPCLKERLFGLANAEGNHGEDAKEYWWYLDNTPTHSWMRTRYVYPTGPFPYQRLRDENRTRTREEPEFELVDTAIFADGRYVDVTTEWAKAGPRDLCMQVQLRNNGPDPVTLHVLPTVWFRNTWSWLGTDAEKPSLTSAGDRVIGRHGDLGTFAVASSLVGSGASTTTPPILCCDNETNVRLLYDSEVFAGQPATRYPKDGINDHVVSGADTVRPDGTGTKAAFHHVVTIGPGETVSVATRLRIGEPSAVLDLGAAFADVLKARAAEADGYWNQVLSGIEPETATVARQAFAGLLSTKQYYEYDVTRWLDGDPREPSPPAGRGQVRNGDWPHLSAADVIAMPDAWEYPWFASWDLAFHCVTLAHVDPAFAKAQLLLLLDERYQHPNGQIPAYEWNFSDLNPPVQAWAALQVFTIDGGHDRVFLEHALHKLLINVGWWFNRDDAEGDNLFEGGFLGLDNIGPFDRSQPMPDGSLLEQSDGTAWMALMCLDLLSIAVALGENDAAYDGLAATFLDRFCAITRAADGFGLWDDEDGFYYDLLRHPGGASERVRVRSAVGLVPLMAVGQLSQAALDAMPRLRARLDWLRQHRPDVVALMHFDEEQYHGLLAVCDPERLVRVLERVLDPGEFLSDHGVRSLSAAHRANPVTIDIAGHTFGVDYEPAESRSGLYGGNSNWRGPIWMPINALLVASLRRFDAACRGTLLVQCPSGVGDPVGLGHVADELTSRLIGLFLPGDDGRRPALGSLPWQRDPLFFEYFDGDTGLGLGASHQTGWTSLVASLALGWPR